MTGFGGLLLSEVRRFLSRRLFRVLGIVVLALLCVQLVVAYLESSDDPNAGLQEARRQVADCERERARFLQESGQEAVEGWDCGTAEEMAQFHDKRFIYARSMHEVFQGISVFTLIIGLVLGASFVGAEWGSGSLPTLLTWEPRRGRVLLAKLLAALVLVAGIVVLLLGAISLLFFPVGVLRGTTEGASGSFWWSQLGLGVRDVGLGMFGAAFGVSLAMIVRNTGGALGVGFFYGTIADFLLGVWRGGFLEEWLLRYNIARLMNLPVPSNAGEFNQDGIQTQVLTATRPAVILAAYGVAFALIAYAVFRRRDVT